MRKCVDQVYFVERWSKRQGLKISISYQCSNIIFGLSLRIMHDQENTFFVCRWKHVFGSW